MMDEIINPIRRDYLSGMSYAAIGEKYGIDPRTAKRYALNNLPYEYYQNKKKGQNGLIFKNYDLDKINQLIEDYYERSKGVDDPNLLMKTLVLMVEPRGSGIFKHKLTRDRQVALLIKLLHYDSYLRESFQEVGGTR